MNGEASYLRTEFSNSSLDNRNDALWRIVVGLESELEVRGKGERTVALVGRVGCLKGKDVVEDGWLRWAAELSSVS